jgi:glycosyltransferase involved in cell wall biosynthesis
MPVNDAILAQLYQKALAFVFPSLYEGFGLPILEAFSCGCPVALSDSSSFPEVAKEAAIYFDPHIKSSMEEAILKIIHDEKLRDVLRRRGYEALKDFSWKKTAEKTLSLYKSIL